MEVSGGVLEETGGILEVSWGHLGGSQVVAKMVEFLMSPAMLAPIAANFKRTLTNCQSSIQIAIKSLC